MALGLGAQGRGAGLGLAAELVRAVGVEAAELLVLGEEVVGEEEGCCSLRKSRTTPV